VLAERGRLDPAFAAASEHRAGHRARRLGIRDRRAGRPRRGARRARRARRGGRAAGRLRHGPRLDLPLGTCPGGVRPRARRSPSGCAHAARAAALAPGTGMATARAASGRALALVALAEGDAQRAADHALAAADEAAAAGATLELARAQLLAGRATVTGDRDAGIALLTAAGTQGARCGAPRVADEARLALRRAGVRVGQGGARAPGSQERARARDCRPRRRGPHQPRDRRAPLPQREDDRDTPDPRLPEAAPAIARAGRRRGRGE